MTDPCPGQCNAAYRRAQAVYERAKVEAAAARQPAPEPHQVEPIPGDPYWCETCTNLIRTGLVRLDNLAAAAGSRRDGRLPTPAPAIRSSVGRDPASPSSAWDTVDEIAQWAARWEETARALLSEQPWGVALNHRVHRMLPVTMGSRTAAVLVGLQPSAGYLVRVHRRILAHDAMALDFGVELLGLVRRIERQAGLDDTVTRLHAPCPKCDLVALERRDGSEKVACRCCYYELRMDEYERWAKAWERWAKNGTWEEPA